MPLYSKHRRATPPAPPCAWRKLPPVRRRLLTHRSKPDPTPSLPPPPMQPLTAMTEGVEPAGDVASWKVPEVAQWLEAHHFPPAAIESFRTNAVSGADLLQLTDDDLKEHLGLSSLLVSGSVCTTVTGLCVLEAACADTCCLLCLVRWASRVAATALP